MQVFYLHNVQAPLIYVTPYIKKDYKCRPLVNKNFNLT